MPELYARQHDSFITQFMESSDLSESDYLNRDNQVFGKSKNNYIFPVTTRVRFIRSDESDEHVYLIGTFKTEPIIKNYVYFILDKNGIILDMSSNAMTYFNFDYNSVIKNKTKINQIAPKAIVDHKYRTKAGHDLDYLNPKTGETFKFNCCMETIMLKQTRENPEEKVLRGFLMKMEVLVDKKYKEDTATTKSKFSGDSFLTFRHHWFGVLCWSRIDIENQRNWN